MRRPPDTTSLPIPRSARPPSGWRFAPPALLLGLLLAGCVSAAGRPAVATIAFPKPGPERQLALLDEIDGLLSERYLYSEVDGDDWAAALLALENRVASGLADEPFRHAVADLLAELPDGTAAYLTREERLAEAADSGDLYGGIGAFIAFRAVPVPRIVVLSVVEGSPAEAAGLRPHEVIYAIDGQPIRADEGIGATRRIRGPEGTEVRLEIGSPDGSRRIVSVARGQVEPIDVSRGRVMSTGAVHLQVPVRAGDELVEDVGVALQALAEEPDASGLVLDLRVATSDSGWPLQELLALFLDGANGRFVGRSESGPLEVIGRDVQGSQTVPLVILVGSDTRGAPEIFAAAIQASQRGVVVGSTTPGGVFGYATVILSDGSELVYADSSYRTVRGLDVGRSGVHPNIPIEADWDEVTETRDPVLGAGLVLLEQ